MWGDADFVRSSSRSYHEDGIFNEAPAHPIKSDCREGNIVVASMCLRSIVLVYPVSFHCINTLSPKLANATPMLLSVCSLSEEEGEYLIVPCWYHPIFYWLMFQENIGLAPSFSFSWYCYIISIVCKWNIDAAICEFTFTRWCRYFG